MPIEILMPALSPTMKDGSISNWVVKEGDKVKPGDVLVEIETDKAIMEFESSNGGVVGKILVPNKTENIPVGTLIAVLLKNNESQKDLVEFLKNLLKNQPLKETSLPSEDLHAIPVSTAPPSQGMENLPTDYLHAEKSTISKSNNRTPASPLANKVAQLRGLDISQIYGTGPNGRVTKRDVEVFSGNTAMMSVSNAVRFGKISHSLQDVELPMSSMRKIIANRLQESKSTIPHFYLSSECVASKMLLSRLEMNDWLKQSESTEAIKISVNDLIVRAVAITLSKHPSINSYIKGSSIIHKSTVDISVAISVEGGLVAPTLFDANLKNLINISEEIKDIVSRARNGKIKSNELSGGSISISNLGMFGAEEFFPIINPPQSSIVSIGSSRKKPVVENDKIVIAEVITLGFSVDHRVVDGAEAALFLKDLKNLIENPTPIFST